MMSNVDLEPGLPPAPVVRFLDASGPMPAGHYWFSLITYYTEPQSGEQAYTEHSKNGITTMSNSGIDAMGPARKIYVGHKWNTVQLSDIPVDERRPYHKVMMSMDGRTFWQIATAPAISSSHSYYDTRDITEVRGYTQQNGMHTMIIKNPAARYQTQTGTTVTREGPITHSTGESMQSDQGFFTEDGAKIQSPPFQPYTTTRWSPQAQPNARYNEVLAQRQVRHNKKVLKNGLFVVAAISGAIGFSLFLKYSQRRSTL